VKVDKAQMRPLIASSAEFYPKGREGYFDWSLSVVRLEEQKQEFEILNQPASTI